MLLHEVYSKSWRTPDSLRNRPGRPNNILDMELRNEGFSHDEIERALELSRNGHEAEARQILDCMK